jgi:hypothetical protein
MRKWFREHASALFVSLLSGGTIGLFLIGLYLTEDNAGISTRGAATLRAIGVILINLSGVGVAAAVATVFFNFPDVQRYLATSLAKMLAEGDLVGVLNTEAKSRLRERLVHDLIKDRANQIQPSLYRHIESVVVDALANPYVSNTAYTLTILPHDSPGFRREHFAGTFRIHTDHLRRGSTFPARFYRSIDVPEHLIQEFEGWIESAKIVVGVNHFTHQHFQRTSEPLANGMVRLIASFEKTVELSAAETDVVLETVTTNSSQDQAAFFVARYASLGFAATLIFDENHHYEAAWYLSCPPELNRPLMGNETALPSGKTVRTNDWLLPGEGVALTIRRKDQTERTERDSGGLKR